VVKAYKGDKETVNANKRTKGSKREKKKCTVKKKRNQKGDERGAKKKKRAHMYICVYMAPVVLLYMCPHTDICVSSYGAAKAASLIAVVKNFVPRVILLYMCPHPNICVLILIYVSLS
jgi:hypothetical protein